MTAYAKNKIFYISIWFLLILGVKCDLARSNHILSIKKGGSVTIPCLYDKKYTQQKKYWFAGIDYSSKYTNTTENDLSVIDHPDQSLFTVTMRRLQNKHTGPYYCVVDNQGQPTVTYELYIKVQSAPGVSVVNSSVSGHEGGNISVQCLYSSGYKNETKQWCKYTDQSCYTMGKTDTSQNSSVQISDDDEKRSFTVLITGLRLTDFGWYWCSVGNLQVSVQLTVTKQVSVTTDTGAEKYKWNMDSFCL
ncbi:polymeric immunoglobulin receptor-like [Carassius gibelio]|uniref:polymeric immunoglobulin receptor-like n=1 Tax=Carassius gibelio TaxID=101364 RepID=UPI0022796D9A|nr:polymeric immunoglobulin receptor-like [Carassius gibelio]